MKTLIARWISTGLFAAFLSCHVPACASPWVTAYYCTWTLASPTPANLDLRGVTDLIFFSLNPNPDGTLSDLNGMVAANAAAVKLAAHKARAKVLICIGSGGSGASFEGAISPANQAAFVQNIATWVAANGYDGVDIDMEPVTTEDGPAYQSFIRSLRTALGRHALLTAAVQPYGDATVFAPIQKEFNQINIMTYDLSGLWAGWSSWYNSNLYTAGKTMPSNGRPMPSCDQSVQTYIAAGIAPSKLSISACFYGTAWTGDTGPLQSITGATTLDITYEQIVDKYYTDSAFQWDPDTHAAYLSLSTSTPVAFISYDSPQLCQDKVNYVLTNKLGGLMCWNIGQQYCPTHPTDDQNPLLTAIHKAFASAGKK